MAHPLRPASENADPLFSVVDDDDVPFCVVCTGEECVCGAVVAAGHASRVAHLADSTPSAYSPRLSSPVAGPSSSKHIPTLKIKLPAGLLSKARASSSSTHVRSDRKPFDAKRLARPAKLDASARKVKSTLLTKTKAPSRLPARPPLAKKSAALKKKRKNRAAVPWENSESELTDIDAAMLDAFEDDPNDYLPVSTNLPTFIPASFVSAAAVASSPVESSDSDSDSSLTAGFGSDDSMQAEEEDFITGQRHKDRARVKKDGSDDPRLRVQNNWEIKPRMRSVDLEDDMDVDSGEETEAEDDEVDEEETEDDKQEDWGSRRPVATTWSDGEESEIDADLFFANLGSDGSTSSSDENMPEDAPVSPTSPTVPAPTGLALGSLFPFDTTHGWEAEVTLPDLDNLPIFVDADLACFLEPNEESSPSDVDEGPFVSFSDGCERDDEDDGGEDDGAWSDEDAGATTDEDLVDAHGLPTARAMALFKMPVAPVSLAAVAPLATVSPYVPRVDIKARTSFAPAEILAGRGDLEMDGDSDEHDHDGLVTRRARSASWSVSRGGVRFPRMGRFGSSASRQAVIDGKTEDVPSPFARRAPSLRRNRASQSPYRASTARSRGASFSSVGFAFDTPTVEIPTPAPVEYPLAPPIELDDVFHSSLLAADETEADEPPSSSVWDTPATATPGPTPDADIARWDFVPVDMFRHANAPSTDLLRTPGAAPLSVLKDSPFSQMRWPSRERARSASRPPGPFALEHEPTPVPVEKSRQELRRERRAARKAATLPPPPIPSHTPRKRPTLHHAHHANGKARSAGAVQRGGGSFGSPNGNGPVSGW